MQQAAGECKARAGGEHVNNRARRPHGLHDVLMHALQRERGGVVDGGLHAHALGVQECVLGVRVAHAPALSSWRCGWVVGAAPHSFTGTGACVAY